MVGARVSCTAALPTVVRASEPFSCVLSCALAVAAAGCRAGPSNAPSGVCVAKLAPDGAAGFDALRAAFVAGNPGYDVAWLPARRELPAASGDRVVFVQRVSEPAAQPVARPVAQPVVQPVAVGDVLLVRAGETWRLDAPGVVDLLAFSLPTALPDDLPTTVRPDWDPRITDTPGGCATDDDAYRRILLTWREEVGPYVLHALNAHRVRIRDSFTHYHPVDGGFDELYLVQQAPAGARLVTGDDPAAIEARAVDRDGAKALLTTRPLAAGDLVYLPRGTVHRGLGGALVQVISVPGFVPDAEIGVDHHLWAINRRLGLDGDAALPFHLVAARTAVVK